jgi:glycosyltransferase involved in cell wall biosynthesis
VYNGEDFIGEAVESVLKQTLSNFELIIVDDGSTDSTVSILEGMASADRRIRIIRKPNGGIVSALNAGLAKCRALYIARMDADDVSSEDRFAFQADYLDEHPDCVLVGGVARSQPLQGAVTRRTTGGRHSRTNLEVFPPKIAVSMHPLIMLRRSALESIGGYRNSYPYAEDYDLFIRLSAHGTIDNPPKEVLFYRRHHEALSVKNLLVQEQSAIRAECDAISASGMARLQDWLVEPYTRLRIFRRLQTIDIRQAGDYVPRSLRDLLSLSPSRLRSRSYWRLRGLIAYTLLKFTVRRASAAVAVRGGARLRRRSKA